MDPYLVCSVAQCVLQVPNDRPLQALGRLVPAGLTFEDVTIVEYGAVAVEKNRDAVSLCKILGVVLKEGKRLS